ncbi:MAG TPA: hypothetical protein VFH99_00695 [Candidatus Saccharimonadales bacterium]|nr:hypothetical protein [Candidatus Saccharimonadales bacterium]
MISRFGVVFAGVAWGFVFIAIGTFLAINQATQFFWSQHSLMTNPHAPQIGSPLLIGIGCFLVVLGVLTMVSSLVLAFSSSDS